MRSSCRSGCAVGRGRSRPLARPSSSSGSDCRIGPVLVPHSSLGASSSAWHSRWPSPRAVAVHNLTRSYGQGRAAIAALWDLDATFAEGGLHVVTGPSGSGKSTLLRLIAGLDRPTAGTARTLGIELSGLSRANLAALRA